MPRIILVETSTSLCSTALIEGEKVISYKESIEPRAHASMTAVFVDEMLRENGLKAGDCDAVAVSSGPGSYTGLRVGVSTAKGLCFGAGIPLIAVNTPEILFYQALTEGLIPDGCRYIIPMIDARRMEVYTTVFDREGRQLREIEASIITEESFATQRAEGPVLFIGDGAEKCRSILSRNGAEFIQTCPKASAMAVPALKAFNEKRFESTAYFEPFYLKQFVATVSKKGIL